MTKQTQAEEDKQAQADEDKQARADEQKLKKRGFTLRGEESVVMVVRPSRALSLGKYLYTLGLYGIWRKRHVYVLTNRRLMIGKGLVNRTEKSLPMSRIEEASFVRRGAGAHCQIVYTAYGRRRVELVGPLVSKDARRLAGEIQALI